MFHVPSFIFSQVRKMIVAKLFFFLPHLIKLLFSICLTDGKKRSRKLESFFSLKLISPVLSHKYRKENRFWLYLDDQTLFFSLASPGFNNDQKGDFYQPKAATQLQWWWQYNVSCPVKVPVSTLTGWGCCSECLTALQKWFWQNCSSCVSSFLWAETEVSLWNHASWVVTVVVSSRWR